MELNGVNNQKFIWHPSDKSDEIELKSILGFAPELWPCCWFGSFSLNELSTNKAETWHCLRN